MMKNKKIIIVFMTMTAVSILSILAVHLIAGRLNTDAEFLFEVLAGLIIAAVVSALYMRMGSGSFNKLSQSLDGLAAGKKSCADINLDQYKNTEAGHIALSVKNIIKRFTSEVGGLAQTSSQLAVSASELASITENSLQTVTEQQMETEQVATAMNEMTATVEEVSRHAAAASEETKSVNEYSQNGMAVAEKTYQSITSLVESVNKASGVIEKLEKESNEIGAILDVIKGIAEQTNLLALNAAIEAARAGEQGRGFAVVADEVRTLAGRTQQSTHEIEEMINRLQGGAHDSVTVMRQALEKGQTGSEQAVEMRDSLKVITKGVTSINDMNTQIATAAEEQMTVANEINQNIINISALSERNTEDANKSYETSEQLAGFSVQLQDSLKNMDTGEAEVF
ncbi:MAG: methyl-accepting chemotaxis protein [Gammaproteobacteria bacterium]|nr:methyl-accepting chemotaxis protein [Gammaproteobacteria bacterium]